MAVFLCIRKGKPLGAGSRAEMDVYGYAVTVSVLLLFGYWFFSAPDYRFIFLLLYYFPLMFFVSFESLLPKHFKAAVALFILAAGYYFSYHPKWIIKDDAAFVKDVISGEKADVIVRQRPLKEYDCEEILWEGISVSCPKDSNVAGDAKLPVVTGANRLKSLRLLGDGIEEGIGVVR